MRPKMARRFLALALSAVMILESGVTSLAAESSAAFENASDQSGLEAEAVDSLPEAAEKEEASSEKESLKDENVDIENKETALSEVSEEEPIGDETGSADLSDSDALSKDTENETGEDATDIKENPESAEKESTDARDNKSSSEDESSVEDDKLKDDKLKDDKTEKDISLEYPAQRFVKKVGNVKITVDAPAGAFPKGTRLKVKKIRSSAVIDEIKEASGKKHITRSDIKAYDFNFYTDEEENIEPLKEISVRFTNLNIKENREISVFHMEDEKSIADPIDADYTEDESGAVELSVSDFSIYAILETPEEDEESPAASPSEAAEEEPEFGNTANYDSSLNLADGNDSFFGGELIYLYNELSISGNEAAVPAGSYTVIRLSKDKFTAPKRTDISATFERIDNIEITENDSEYIIKTIYKELYGGFTGATPLKVSLKAGKTENLTKAVINQEYYSPKGKKLSESEVEVNGKAAIETIYGANYSAEALKLEQADDKYVIKQGVYISFRPNSISRPNANMVDPRGRRIYVRIPKGTKIKENTGWSYEESSGRYFKDINRIIELNDLSVVLDISGNDYTLYDTAQRPMRYDVKYSMSPIKDGLVKNDLGPAEATVTKYYYLPKKAIIKDAYHSIFTARYRMYIGKDNNALKGRSWDGESGVNLPYDSSQLSEVRAAFEHRVISNISIYNPKDDTELWKFVIKSSVTDVPGYTYPSEIRLNIRGLGEDSDFLKEKLEGTKAYGIKYDGTKELISDNVPIITSENRTTSLGEEDLAKFDGREYKSVEFVYPGDGIVLTGKDEIYKYSTAFYTLVIADIRPDILVDLKKLISENKIPQINGIQRNAPGYSVYDDFSRVFYEITYKVKDDDTSQTTQKGSQLSDTDSVFRLQYDYISRANDIGITNGSSFYVYDIVTSRTAYTHTRYGSFADATEPENLNLYYLVPDGLEPIDDPEMFKELEVIRGYLPGKNLVVAKPETMHVPYITDLNRNSSSASETNYYALSFKVTERLDIGSYNISAAVAFDNNRIDVKNGRQYGILNNDTPSGDWADLNKNARNRPEYDSKFTDLRSAAFSVYPPKVLVPMKSVKLSSEPDTAYASSVGKKATIGTEIDYRWRLQNNSTQAIKNLTIIDILPYAGDKAIVENAAKEYPQRGSKFKTPLIGMEPQDKFDIYYSTDAVKSTTAENRDANWSDTVEDMSKVTMIKAVLKDGQTLGVNEKYDIVTHNRIENSNTINDGDKAYNSFAISTNNGAVFIEGLKTEVAVTYPKKDVSVIKTDEDDSSVRLEGVTFDLYEAGSDKPVKEELKTDRNGHFVIPDLLVGKDYYLIETSTLEGYELSDEKIPFTVTAGETPVEVMINNKKERTEVTVKKEWIGKESDYAGVILIADGVEKERAKLTRADDWSHTFTDLRKTDPATGKEISYTVEEAGADSEGKVRLSDGVYSFSVSGNAEDGYIITNKRLPETKPDPNPDPDPEKPSKGGRSGGGGGGGTGGGKNINPTPSMTPEPIPVPENDTPVTEVPGDVPPAPWYKLPVMGDTQFGPGFVHEEKDEVNVAESEKERPVIDQLKGLYEQNNDLSGWLTVPGTGFGYPVMNSPYAPYYYQHHTFMKNADEVGIPFTGPYSNAQSMNVLIHGHNMKDVSQFGYIWNYQYKSFRDKNPVIDFKTLYDDKGSYEVMAVFFAPEYPEGTKDVFWWYRYIGDMNKEQFEYFVRNAKAASLYDTGVNAEFGDKLITLETCTSSTDSTRLVVVAKKTEQGISKE